MPPPQERRVYEPVVIQQRLSLWDSLNFTDKVSFLSGVTADYITYRMGNAVQARARLSERYRICYQPCLAQHQAVNTAAVRLVQAATGNGGPGTTLSAELLQETGFYKHNVKMLQRPVSSDGSSL